jgi:hypothetical protein
MLAAVDFQAPGAPEDKYTFLQLRDLFIRSLGVRNKSRSINVVCGRSNQSQFR